MDNEFDGCECIWSHELAMRRLLSLLRQSQSDCTDTICLAPPTTPNQNSDGSGDFMMLAMLAVLMMLLYLLKPKSLRNSGSNTKNEPFNDRTGPNNGSPPPAVN